jgi:hypothetical protein
MAIEMLAIKIRSNNNIRGLEFQGLKTKVFMCAKDSSFILSPQTRSLQCLIEDLDNFSGLKLNYDKCTILRTLFKKYNFYISLQFTYKMG